jgi:hypothetical protein
MCKIVIYTQAPLVDRPKSQRRLFNRLLTELGRTEKDGLGIAWTDAEGKIHRRRWATSEDFKGMTVDDYRSMFCEVSSEPVDETPASGFVLLHGRTATSEKGLRNAHPHVGNSPTGAEFALVHNGIVTASPESTKELGELMSGCDSELILAAFIAGGMPKVSELIFGYYAFAVIVVNPDGSRHLHVVRDARASLFAGEDKGGHYIFATTSDLVTMAGAEKCARVSPLIHLTFDKGGTWMDMEDIPEPKATWSMYQRSGGYGSDYHSPSSLPGPINTPTGQKTILLPEKSPTLDVVAQQVRQDDYLAKWRKANGFTDDDETRRPPRVFVQGEVVDGEIVQDELPMGGENRVLAELDRRIASTDMIIHRLTHDLDPDSPDRSDMEKKIARKCERRNILAEQKRHILERNGVTSGVSGTHGTPISCDEASALKAAEREAAGYPTGPGEDEGYEAMERAAIDNFHRT